MSFVDKHRLALHMQYVHLMLHEPMLIHSHMFRFRQTLCSLDCLVLEAKVLQNF